MTDPVVLSLFWYPFLAFFAWGLHRQTRCFTHWNLFTLFAGLLILFHGIYVPWCINVNYDTDGVQVTAGSKATFIFNVMLAFSMILLGAYLANRTKGFKPRQVGELPPPKAMPSGAGIWRLIIVAVIMVAIGAYVDSQSMGGVSFMDMLKGNVDADQYKMSRFIFNRSTSGEQGIIFYFARIMFVSWMLLFIVISFFQWKGRRRYGLAMFAGLSVIYLQHSLMTGHKAPIAYYILVMFAAWSISKGKRNFRRYMPLAVALFVLLFFVLIPLQFMLQYSHATYFDAVESALYRVAIEPNRCLMLYYDTYPNRYPFTGLSSIPMVAKALGIPIAIPAHTYIPLFEHGQIGQTWNAAFFADAWVGFGWPGTVFFSLLVGYLLQRVNIWFERSEKNLLKTGLFIALIIVASRLSATSLPSTLMTFGLGTYFLLYFMVKQWGRPETGKDRPKKFRLQKSRQNQVKLPPFQPVRG
jgi:oligosaccharide repeat unit polymerase